MDILLDNALHSALEEETPGVGDYEPFGVVDYCCYISSLDAGAPRIRSGFWSLGCRGYNVKLLKLHGSMNWLQCPNCQRLFVQFGSKQDILNRSGSEPCRHCRKSGYDNRLAGRLGRVLRGRLEVGGASVLVQRACGERWRGAYLKLRRLLASESATG